MPFLIVFLIPGSVIVSVLAGQRYGHPNLFLALPWLLGYVIVPALTAWWPRAPFQVSEQQAASRGWQTFFRGVPLCAPPLQLVMLLVTTLAAASGIYSAGGLIALTLATGVFSAMFAINIAHELIHRRNRLDRFVGGVLLSMVCFGTFPVVHLQVHHPFVGTDLDFATARRGETIYAFWRRSLWGNFPGAFRREWMRLRRSGRSPLGSEVTLWWTFSLVWLGGALYLGGWRGGLFFLTQSLIAVMYLDVINFLQHYGLTRGAGADGRLERVQEHHSWTAALFLDDLLLLNLPRHAHHHAQPQHPYQLLRDSAHAPRYPYTYGTMTLLLLVPALFRAVAHPRLDAFEAARAREQLATGAFV